MPKRYYLYHDYPVRVRDGAAEFLRDGDWIRLEGFRADSFDALPVTASQFDACVKKALVDYCQKENWWNPDLHPRGQPENAGEFVERPDSSSPYDSRHAANPKPTRGRPETRRQRRERTSDAARLHFFRSAAWRRIVEHALKNEEALADGIGGHNLPDSEPADVVFALPADGQPITDRAAVRDFLRQREKAVQTLRKRGATDEELEAAQRVLAQPGLFFEVKTLLTQAAGQVHMSAPAVARKKR